jgi:LDH2 family malate/lactate/ureidoglycolate dehydrogenase
MNDFVHVEPEPLLDFATAVYRQTGMPEADARLVADTLVQADLWGHQSHGVMRLGWYHARLKAGVCEPVARPELVVDAGAIAVIDGHDAMGQVLTAHAAREAIARAKRHGIGAVALRNSNHFGTAMYYSLMGSREDCVVMVTTNASPAMAPWGGREKRVGTNPWSLAAPAGRHAPMVLDIANTAVARGKIYLAKQKGTHIPAGWALDTFGAPTTDAVKAVAGLIAPMAGHKGYAIAVMMDMLSGVLTGSAFGAAVQGPYQSENRSGCGHLIVALNIAAFMLAAEFGERMEQLIAQLKSTPLASGNAEIFYPGELEARSAVRQLSEGLVLPKQTIADLDNLANELNIDKLFR